MPQQNFQAVLNQISSMFPGVSADKMTESLNAAVAGKPLSTEDIISQLKSPFSRLRRDVSDYIIENMKIPAKMWSEWRWSKEQNSIHRLREWSLILDINSRK